MNKQSKEGLVINPATILSKFIWQNDVPEIFDFNKDGSKELNQDELLKYLLKFNKWIKDNAQFTALPAVNGLQAVDELLLIKAKELDLDVDFSDKEYDGDKSCPMDRIGLLDYLLNEYNNNTKEWAESIERSCQETDDEQPEQSNAVSSVSDDEIVYVPVSVEKESETITRLICVFLGIIIGMCIASIIFNLRKH